MAAEMAERVGIRMRTRREELGLTQAQLAALIEGKAEGAQVSRWERGKHQPQDLAPIARALEVDLSYFYAPEPDKNDTPSPFDSSAAPGALDETLREIREQNTIILDAIHHSAEQATRQRDEIIAGIETLLEALEGRVEESVTGVEHLQNAFDRVLEALDAPDPTADSEQSSPPKPETARRARSRQRASSAPR
jgi:transcriptional regulator with XRE-family HTH domain